MARRGDMLLLAAAVLLLGITGAAAEDAQVNTIQDVFRHLRTCWRPPPPAKARPIDITVVVSFNRSGNILGHPRITYEFAEASDNDRLQYRVAVMEALQRCTPMPFTEPWPAPLRDVHSQSSSVTANRHPTDSPPTQERRA